jgi:hypothetical protein
MLDVRSRAYFFGMMSDQPLYKTCRHVEEVTEKHVVDCIIMRGRERSPLQRVDEVAKYTNH